jgi:hypothetical protein
MATENADLKRLTNDEVDTKLRHAYGTAADGSPRTSRPTDAEILEMIGQ